MKKHLILFLIPFVCQATQWAGPKNIFSVELEPQKSWSEFIAAPYELENNQILIARDTTLSLVDEKGRVTSKIEHNLGCSAIANQRIHVSPNKDLLIIPCRVRASYLMVDRSGKLLGHYQMFKGTGNYVKLDEAPGFLSDGRIITTASFSHEARIYIVDPKRPKETDFVKLPGKIRDITRPVVMNDELIMLVGSGNLFLLNSKKEISKQVEFAGFNINTHQTASIKVNQNTALFAGFRNNEVYAIKTDGTISSLLKISNPSSLDLITRFFKYDNGNILISTSNGQLFLYDPDLKPIKNLTLAGEVFLTDAVSYKGNALLVSTAGRALSISSALEIVFDHRLWNSGEIEHSPAVLQDGTLAVHSMNHRLYRIDLSQTSFENEQPGDIQSRIYKAAAGLPSTSDPLTLHDGSVAVRSGTRTLDILNPDATLRARYITGESNGIGGIMRPTPEGVMIGAYENVFHINTQGEKLFDFKKTKGFIFGFFHQFANGTIGLVRESGWGVYTFEFYRTDGKLLHSVEYKNGGNNEGKSKLDRSMKMVELSNGNVAVKSDPHTTILIITAEGKITEKELPWTQGRIMGHLSGERLTFLGKDGKLTITDQQFEIKMELALKPGEFTDPLVQIGTQFLTISENGTIHFYTPDGQLANKVDTPLINISRPLIKDDGSFYVAGGANELSGYWGNILRYSKSGNLEENIKLHTEWKHFKPVLAPLLGGELVTTVTGDTVHFFRKKPKN